MSDHGNFGSDYLPIQSIYTLYVAVCSASFRKIASCAEDESAKCFLMTLHHYPRYKKKNCTRVKRSRHTA